MAHTVLKKINLDAQVQISSISELLKALSNERHVLISHPVYESICAKDDVRTFMQQHVWSIWADMCHLKAVQSRLTCVNAAWRPVATSDVRRIINEMVLEEESDVTYLGKFSHFELYHSAMKICGADCQAIEQFIEYLHQGNQFKEAIEAAKPIMPIAAYNYANEAMRLTTLETPELLGAFAASRIDLIPDLFRAIVLDVTHDAGDQFDLFIAYLDRHIHMNQVSLNSSDTDLSALSSSLNNQRSPNPRAMKLVEAYCQDDKDKWQGAYQGAIQALKMRKLLCDEITRTLI